MVTLLRRIFIKNYQNVGSEHVRMEHGKLASWFGIISNFILVSIKIGAAIFLWSQTNWTVLSMALIGDAVNNLSDLASCVVTLISFKMSAKPADKKHPFGHERIEYIAGLIVSIAVVIVGLELFRDSLSKVIAQEQVQYDLITVILLAVAVLIKLLQGYFNHGIGKAIGSPALAATSVDSLTDALATFLVMISGILSLTIHINYLDGYMGIAVSIFVLFSGLKMIKSTAEPLIGEAPDPALVNAIVKTVTSHKEILGVHDLICHSYGPTKYFISLHAEVNQNMAMISAHDVIDNIEEEVRRKYHVEITIHMDPVAVGDPVRDALMKEVAIELASYDKELHFHDFRIVKGPTHTNVIFDIVVPFDDKHTQEEIVKKLEAHFANRETRYHFAIHFDRPFD